MTFACSCYAIDSDDEGETFYSDKESDTSSQYGEEHYFDEVEASGSVLTIVRPSMKAQYPELFTISFVIDDFEVRVFEPADFTDEICGGVFSSDRGSSAERNIISMESLASAFQFLDKPCLGIFRISTKKCIGTTSLSVGEYFDHSLKSGMRLINEDGVIGRESVIRKALNLHLKGIVDTHEYSDIHCLEVSFANDASVIGTDLVTGLIRYMPDAGAPQLNGIVLPSDIALFYYSLKDS
jgi:hypothetical protein